ncbi:ribulose-phosphate 3-epimerase [Ruminococcaceae bacterium OttesenSCG-928-N02]|nr:ribulose-phosphate 3-epimerase [Ruminococcaceae bacterium OttesenSCG-928-N02]
MVKVAPSILAADFANLAQDCARLTNEGADMLHVDIMDGVFVPNLSIGVPVVAALHRALPQVFLDVHMMLQNPLQYVQPFAQAGAGLISFHLEADSPAQQTIEAIHAQGIMAGIVIKPGTPVQAVFPYLDQVELVLVMAVEPGFGAQKFMPIALEKLAAISAQAKKQGITHLMLEVDGGIGPQTCPQVVAHGANVVVAGSAVFGADDAPAAFHALGAHELSAQALHRPPLGKYI